MAGKSGGLIRFSWYLIERKPQAFIEDNLFQFDQIRFRIKPAPPFRAPGREQTDIIIMLQCSCGQTGGGNHLFHGILLLSHLFTPVLLYRIT